jgi:hypothetical protein
MGGGRIVPRSLKIKIVFNLGQTSLRLSRIEVSLVLDEAESSLA